jgi:hypothetical protein
MTRPCLLLGLLPYTVTACQAPPPSTEPALSTPPTAALALAKTFAPDVVGNTTPITPAAGDYAMALTLRFESFPSTEMHVDESRTGAIQLTLARDGTARACIGSHQMEYVVGQYKYEPPDREQPPRSTGDLKLVALAGRWRTVDGIAIIELDRVSWSTCDVADARTTSIPLAMRCIGVAPTDHVPVAGLACEASNSSVLFHLGLPMTAQRRNVPDYPIHSSPDGPDVVLGAPGILVDAVQGDRDAIPRITFRKGAVTLVESDYRPAK